MRIIEIRPARIQARYVQWGDVLVSSPHTADGNGERPSRWIGTVVGQGEVENGAITWRIKRVDDQLVEGKPVPLDGFVWVHLPAGQV